MHRPRAVCGPSIRSPTARTQSCTPPPSISPVSACMRTHHSHIQYISTRVLYMKKIYKMHKCIHAYTSQPHPFKHIMRTIYKIHKCIHTYIHTLHLTHAFMYFIFFFHTKSENISPLSGHSDAMGGALVVPSADAALQLRQDRTAMGSTPGSLEVNE